MVAGDQSDPVDCLILGGGPGGYVAALRAALLGRSVTLVERARVGGVCLNEGCIPSKHLWRFAAAKAAAEKLAQSGMPAFAGPPDMAAFQKSRAAVVDTLVKGVSSLLAAAGVKVVTGAARFVGRTRVCVEIGEESVRYFDFKDVVIATGSEAVALEALPFDGNRVVEVSRALEWGALPASLLVVGSDYIALEIAVAYARLGSTATLAAPASGSCPTSTRISRRRRSAALAPPAWKSSSPPTRLPWPRKLSEWWCPPAAGQISRDWTCRRRG